MISHQSYEFALKGAKTGTISHQNYVTALNLLNEMVSGLTQQYLKGKDRYTVAIDATEQICVEDLPIIQIGHLVKGHVFRPICLAVANRLNKRTFDFIFNYIKDNCTGPPIAMMADGDKACRAACSEVFPSCIQTMCWWHLTKNLKRKASKFYFAPNFITIHFTFS